MKIRSLNVDGTNTLVIDSHASVRIALRMRLAEWGADAAEADSGARGIAEVTGARDSGRPFELLFVASAMSPMSGFELVEYLGPRSAELGGTILMLSAEHTVDDVARAQKLGVPAYVVKPLRGTSIVNAVSAVLSLDRRPQRPAEHFKLRRARILLAEDAPEVALIIRKEIEGTDYQVDVAPDGGVAVNLFRLGEYDLVLMDIQMPKFDGYWATGEIRAWERTNQLKRTPIVALTAFANKEDAQKSFRAGLDGHLVKPIEKEKLLAVIGRYLRRR